MTLGVLPVLACTDSTMLGKLNNQEKETRLRILFAKAVKKKQWASTVNVSLYVLLLRWGFWLLNFSCLFLQKSWRAQERSSEEALSRPYSGRHGHGEESGRHWSWCQWPGLHTVLPRGGAGAHLLREKQWRGRPMEILGKWPTAGTPIIGSWVLEQIQSGQFYLGRGGRSQKFQIWTAKLPRSHLTDAQSSRTTSPQPGSSWGRHPTC